MRESGGASKIGRAGRSRGHNEDQALPAEPRRRIVILTNADYGWAFPAWAAAIPLLQREHDVTGLMLFPDRLGTRTGLRIPLWYLEVFGLVQTGLLALYAVKAWLARQRSPIRTWADLSTATGVPVSHATSPNAPAVIDAVRAQQADIAFAMVGHILKPPILGAPTLGVIGKHAGLLPACRGVLPYFWARRHGLPAGVSFFKLDAGIDTGQLLVQQRYADEGASLLGFYIDVFHAYPGMACEAARRLSRGEELPPPAGVASSYFSFPTRADARAFRAAGFRLARVADLGRAPNPAAFQ